MSNPRYEIAPGRPHPLGAVPDANGVNFSVFSRNATAVELLLFDEHDDREPAQIVKLDAAANKTFFFWHVYVKGLRPGATTPTGSTAPRTCTGKGSASIPTRSSSTPTPTATPTRSGTGPMPAARTTIWQARCGAWSSTFPTTTGKATARSTSR